VVGVVTGVDFGDHWRIGVNFKTAETFKRLLALPAASVTKIVQLL
jgi:hypothetical protein